MTAEVPLGGGATHASVVRVGDTVRRPPQQASRLMRELLVYLENAGFAAAPRWLGTDDRGRDILTWIDGEALTERAEMPEFTDSQLVAVTSLLRAYHDVVAGSPLAAGADVVCHGDFGPWNLIWRDGLPIAAIDFDNAYPGERGDDVAYVMRTFLRFGLVAAAPSDLARRARLVVATYGTAMDIPRLLGREYDAAEARCRANGWHRQLATLPLERGWLAEHGVLLSG